MCLSPSRAILFVLRMWQRAHVPCLSAAVLQRPRIIPALGYEGDTVLISIPVAVSPCSPVVATFTPRDASTVFNSGSSFLILETTKHVNASVTLRRDGIIAPSLVRTAMIDVSIEGDMAGMLGGALPMRRGLSRQDCCAFWAHDFGFVSMKAASTCKRLTACIPRSMPLRRSFHNHLCRLRDIHRGL